MRDPRDRTPITRPETDRSTKQATKSKDRQQHSRLSHRYKGAEAPVVGNGHVGGLPLFSQVELVSRLEEWAVVEVLITI